MGSSFRCYALLLLAPLLAGVFGIVHDQVTFSLAPHYYTHFKYIQFQLAPEWQNRWGVGLIGFLATWWVGLFIGLVFAGVLIFRPQCRVVSRVWRAYGIAFGFTMAGSLAGWLMAEIALVSMTEAEMLQRVMRYSLPSDIVIYQSFIRVGGIHNGSYLGGAAGLVMGAWWLGGWRWVKVRTGIANRR